MTTTHLPGAATAVRHADRERVQVRVWDHIVRATHWLVVLSFVVLGVTGFYLGRPFLIAAGRAGDHFVMGTVKVIHFYAAIVFSLAVLTRIAWMFVGPRHARWYNLVPVTRARWRGIFETLRFYLFLRERPAPDVGHNPLAGLAYGGVFGLYLVMIATGLGLYAISAHVDSPFRAFAFVLDLFGGAQTARWIHHVVMWVLVVFSVQHIYSALLTDATEKNGTIDSIFSGNKWVSAEDALEEEESEGKRG